MTVLEHVKEGGAAPVLRGVAIAGRSIFERIALVGFGIVPAKSTSLEHWMQRIDEDEAARQIETFRTATLAEATQQIVLGEAGQALANQPVHQVQTGCEVHKVLCRAITHGERLAAEFRPCLRFPARDRLTIFLHERADGMVEQIQHRLGWAA